MAVEYGKDIARRNGNQRARDDKRKYKNRKTDRLLLQLMTCILLFVTVFSGRGVFPSRVCRIGEKLGRVIGESVDVMDAAGKLEEVFKARSLFRNGKEVQSETQGPECISDIFSNHQISNLISPEQERRFLNTAPSYAQAAAHYLQLEKLPEEWFTAKSGEIAHENFDKEAGEQSVLKVGDVIQAAHYTGLALPERHTMDELFLGELSTVSPVNGTLRSPYGYRRHPIDGSEKFHSGVDLGAPQGADIVAFAPGKVEYIGESDIFGYYLQLDHGQGVKSFYAHCRKLCVEQGQHVGTGEKVAEVGSTGRATGPHLHFEIKCAGIHVDPAYYIDYHMPT